MKADRLDVFERGLWSWVCFLFLTFLYIGCLKRVAVKTWAGLLEMWKGCYHDKEVRVRVEELLSLVTELRTNLPSTCSITKVGELLPEELSLFECKSGEAIYLKTFWKQSKFTLFVPLKFYFWPPCNIHLEGIVAKRKIFEQLWRQFVVVDSTW